MKRENSSLKNILSNDSLMLDYKIDVDKIFEMMKKSYLTQPILKSLHSLCDISNLPVPKQLRNQY